MAGNGRRDGGEGRGGAGGAGREGAGESGPGMVGESGPLSLGVCCVGTVNDTDP